MKIIFLILTSISILYAADDNFELFINEAKKACFKGHAMSCQLIGEYHSVGAPANKNHFEANKYFAKGCELNVGTSCAHLAYAYANGFGIRQDTMTAWELYGKACDLGSQDGCTAYAAMNRAAENRK